MTVHIHSQSYGKSRVRLSRISRDGPKHNFTEISVSIALEGDFAAAYTAADNRLVIATDSMKNIVYALAHQHGVASLEEFGLRIATHFLDAYEHVSKVSVSLEERPWNRMVVDRREHPHSFIAGGSERNVCDAEATRDAAAMRSGLRGLQVLKTTGSSFTEFLRDPYTTLKDADDRIFATTIEANWPSDDMRADWAAARVAIRSALLQVFAEEFSPSVQATLYQMAEAALAKCSIIDEISITMPNQHHLLANLALLGMTNANVTFVPTDEPFGLISAVVRRGETEPSP